MIVMWLIVAFLLGTLAGAVGVVRWWSRKLDDPEVVRNLLKAFYRRAHPHWLQKSADDTARVCPCCGWSETEGLASDQTCQADRRQS